MAAQSVTRKSYPTDLSDAEWQKIEPLVPKPKTNRGRKRKHPIREILNAIFYLLRTGCAWRMLPHDFPPWKTVYYKPALTRKPGKKGRPRLKGARLPTLEHILGDKKTVWKKVTIRDWYGEKRRQIEIVSRAAVWYHSGKPPLPIRWMLIRDPKGKFRSQALLCTDLNVDAVQIVKWFVMRWRLEVTFREVRTHLGVETQRQWSDWAGLLHALHQPCWACSRW